MIAANLVTLAVAAATAAAAPVYKRASGQATYYAAGLGACGWTNSGSDFIVALNAPQWVGSSGQASSHCGQQVVITNNKNGNTQTAQVADLCPGCGYGSLDMSTGLFSALNNGNMDDGVFPISWHWAGESAEPQQAAASTTSKAAPKATYTKQVESSTTPSPTAAKKAVATHAASSTSYAPQPSSTASPNTVETTPEWWAEIDNSCGFTPDAKTVPVIIGPSAVLAKEDLANACGKWIQIENNDNGKALSVQVTSYNPDAESGFIALADGYKLLSKMNGDYPETIKSATWGFIDGQDM